MDAEVISRFIISHLINKTNIKLKKRLEKS